jgi:predicted O-methyltransferase YrrM
MWGDRRYHDGLKLAVNDKFADQIAAGQVEVNLGYSTTVVDRFAEAYFDWIYIDTDHSYRTTKLELEKYSLKVKPGGIIAGHDYIIGGWNRVVRYGVIEAVNEFCVTHHWEMIYLSLERSISPSFAIRKMDA